MLSPCCCEPCLSEGFSKLKHSVAHCSQLILLCVFRKFCHHDVQSLLTPLLWQHVPLVGHLQPTLWSSGNERDSHALLHTLLVHSIYMNNTIPYHHSSVHDCRMMLCQLERQL